jgi:hypothetical protein
MIDPNPTVGDALVAEVAQRASQLIGCDKNLRKIIKWVENYGSRLHPDDVDYLVELSLSLAERARGLADILRKAQRK